MCFEVCGAPGGIRTRDSRIKSPELRSLYLELTLTDGEYHQERQRLQEQLRALAVPDEGPVVSVGAYVDDLPSGCDPQ